MMKIRVSITRMKYTVCFMEGMSKQTLNLYVNILNDSPITAVINLAAVHLDNNCVKFLALNLCNRTLYVNILNDSPITAVINLTPVHLDNNCVKFWL